MRYLLVAFFLSFVLFSAFSSASSSDEPCDVCGYSGAVIQHYSYIAAFDWYVMCYDLVFEWHEDYEATSASHCWARDSKSYWTHCDDYPVCVQYCSAPSLPERPAILPNMSLLPNMRAYEYAYAGTSLTTCWDALEYYLVYRRPFFLF